MNALVELRRRIESTGALIAKHEQAIASDPTGFPPSFYANVRALQKLHQRLDADYQAEAEALDLEIYRYRLLTDVDQPTVAGVAEAWSKLQKLFSSVYSALGKSGKSVKSKRPALESPQLGYAYTFPGSVGVVMTIPRETTNLIGDSLLSLASETVFDLIEAKNLEEVARSLGPAPIHALNEWAKSLQENHFGMGLEWRSQSVIKRTTEIQYPQLSALQLTVYTTETKSTTTITGELVMVDVEEKKFRIKSDDNKEIDGSFTDAINAEHAASVPARYQATILTTTKIVTEDKEQKSLVSLVVLQAL